MWNHRRGRSVCLPRKGGRMRRYIYFLIAAVFIGCGTISGCGKTQEEDKHLGTSEKVKKEAKEALDTTMDYAQKKSREYQEKIKESLKDYDKKMDELKAKSATMTEEAKADFNKTMEQLKEKKEAASKKLQELKKPTGKAWEDVKAGVNEAMADLKEAYEKAITRYNK